MLIELEDSVTETILKGNAGDIVALDNLLATSFNGHHGIQVSQNTAKALLASNKLSLRSNSVLQRCLNSYAQTFHFYKSLKTRISIHGSTNGQLIEKLDLTRWRAQLQNFYHVGLQPTVLLAENLTDSELYFYAARHFAISNNFSPELVSASCRGGGGTTIVDELQNITNTKREFVICITDSDRRSPNCGLNETSRQCAAIIALTNWVVGHSALNSENLKTFFLKM